MPYDTARKVLEIEAAAILSLRDHLDAGFDRAVEGLFACEGRVVVTGMGKSGLIGRKLSATFASTGSPSYFLHPADAIHGDLGRIVKSDAVVALSKSGDTAEILALLPSLKRLGVFLVAMTAMPRSVLARSASVHLDVSIREEACPLGLTPTASTTAALAMGDALAMALLERRGFSVEDFARLHPGGGLGRQLLRVEDVMGSGDKTPRVGLETPMQDVLFEMTRKRLGMTTVQDASGRLLGVLSDGDLRRQMERHGHQFLDRRAAECMSAQPVTIGRRELATQALHVMESRKITSLVVVAEDSLVEGVVHLHDLWKTELI